MALKHLVRPFARYLRDQAGISALEFALTAPLLIACLAGMGELSQLLVADRDVIKISTSLADLTAEASNVTAATPAQESSLDQWQLQRVEWLEPNENMASAPAICSRASSWPSWVLLLSPAIRSRSAWITAVPALSTESWSMQEA